MSVRGLFYSRKPRDIAIAFSGRICYSITSEAKIRMATFGFHALKGFYDDKVIVVSNDSVITQYSNVNHLTRGVLIHVMRKLRFKPENIGC